MKTKTKFIDEMTGGEYDTEAAALRAEKKNKAINAMFAFVDMSADKKGDGCDFGNGGYCVQRTKEYYDRLRATVVKAVKKYEPWIDKEFKSHDECPNGLTVEIAHPFGLLGRFIGDSDSIIQDFFSKYKNICQKCYREWGQGYFAIHCPHNGKAAEHGL
jgi:hypothetical protein